MTRVFTCLEQRDRTWLLKQGVLIPPTCQIKDGVIFKLPRGLPCPLIELKLRSASGKA